MWGVAGTVVQVCERVMRRVTAETLIRRARGGEDVPVLYPREAEQTAEPEAQCRTRTGDPFLTMEVLYQLS